MPNFNDDNVKIPAEIAETIVEAIEVVVAAALKSDEGLFELIKGLIKRVELLETKLDLLLLTTKGKH